MLFFSKPHTHKHIHKESLIIGTLNIINGNVNRLELACATLDNIGIDIGLLTETKLNEYHTFQVLIMKYGQRNVLINM